MATITTRDILDKKVLTQDGRDVGHVEALELDTAGWRVPALRVKVRRDQLEGLGLKRPLIGGKAARIAVDQVADVTDHVILKSPFEAFGAVLRELEGKKK
ncbi:MAG: PRC-barrel domain-containing protein [Myxococcota bacterium]